jgi:hypothetical protein
MVAAIILKPKNKQKSKLKTGKTLKLNSGQCSVAKFFQSARGWMSTFKSFYPSADPFTNAESTSGLQ